MKILLFIKLFIQFLLVGNGPYLPLTSANPGAQGALGVPEKRLSCPTVGPSRNTSNTHTTHHTHIDLRFFVKILLFIKLFIQFLLVGNGPYLPLTSANPGAQGALGVPEKRLSCPTVGP